VTVALNEKRDVYEAHLLNLGVKGAEIPTSTVKKYEKLLAGGMANTNENELSATYVHLIFQPPEQNHPGTTLHAVGGNASCRGRPHLSYRPVFPLGDLSSQPCLLRTFCVGQGVSSLCTGQTSSTRSVRTHGIATNGPDTIRGVICNRGTCSR
jgi:hypothetical protein